MTNTDGTAYTNASSLQAFTDAGFAMTLEPNGLVCAIDGQPAGVDTCGGTAAGKWWSFWTAAADAPWSSSNLGPATTQTPAGGFIGFSYVDGAPDWSTPAPEPRVATGPTPTSTATTTSAPAGTWQGSSQLAATWLANQAVAGTGDFGPNAGLSQLTDAYIGLMAADPTNPNLPALLQRIEDGAATYATFTDDSTTPATQYVFGDAVSKLLYIADLAHADVHSFGGLDLPALLAANTTPAGQPGAGAVLSGGSPVNEFSQAYAVLGEAGAGILSTPVVAALEVNQCPAGYFRMYVTLDAAGNATKCADGTDAADVDGTAMGVMALIAARESGQSVPDAEIVAARDWLLTQQQPSGGFPGSAWTPDANTNSTGLAAAALAAIRDAGFDSPKVTTALQQARAFTATAQANTTTDTGTSLSSDVGAIAYTPTIHDGGRTDGVEPNRAQWQRATTQGIVALVPTGFNTLITIPFVAPPTQTATTTSAPATSAPATTGPSSTAQTSTTAATTPAATSPATAAAALTPPSSPTAGSAPQAVSGTGLAQTGADLAPVLVVALLILFAGAALLLLAARQRPAYTRRH